MKMLNHYFKILPLSALLLASSAYSAEFCVENSTQLYLFLSIADSNNQSDHIKIASGSYPIDVSSFIYDASITQETNDLKISGGWTLFANNPCGQQLSTPAFDTILDGEDENLIMSFKMAGHADLEISNLFFFRGNGPSGDGGAVRIDYDTGTEGDVLIENNAFISNSGNAATALSVDIADTTTVRNNVFFANHADNSFIVRINSGAYGIYFTNNTVLANTHDNASPQTAVYLQFSAPSQAFVANNVFWDNQDTDIGFFTSQGFSYFKNNDYQAIATSINLIGEFSGNFTLDPQFEPSLLFHVPSITSPLTNAGIKSPFIVGIPPDFDETWYIGENDVLGNDRIIGDKIDIGAYEALLEDDVIFENGFE